MTTLRHPHQTLPPPEILREVGSFRSTCSCGSAIKFYATVRHLIGPQTPIVPAQLGAFPTVHASVQTGRVPLPYLVAPRNTHGAGLRAPSL